jgi:sirohydrochlorin cobaltochelatase
MKRGLLLFAHGARDAAWTRPFEEVAARVRAAAPDLEVELAYLELMTPNVIEAGARLAAAACAHVVVVPLFLGAGGHVRKDVPELLARLEGEHPAIRWTLAQPVGETERVVRALAEAALDALDGIIAPSPSPD